MIPPFNEYDVLPPFLGDPTLSAGRAPFRATIEDVVERFAISDQRRRILSGLLDFRAALRAAGMTDGVQWLDGSFVENRSSEPNDVDVVTFHVMDEPSESAMLVTHQSLLDWEHTKVRFMVDAYFVPLISIHPWQLVRDTAYWYGLFSHQRETERWKGMVEVILASQDDDAAARALLMERAP